MLKKNRMIKKSKKVKSPKRMMKKKKVETQRMIAKVNLTRVKKKRHHLNRQMTKRQLLQLMATNRWKEVSLTTDIAAKARLPQAQLLRARVS